MAFRSVIESLFWLHTLCRDVHAVQRERMAKVGMTGVVCYQSGDGPTVIRLNNEFCTSLMRMGVKQKNLREVKIYGPELSMAQ
jgi:hypothetical protein